MNPETAEQIPEQVARQLPKIKLSGDTLAHLALAAAIGLAVLAIYRRFLERQLRQDAAFKERMLEEYKAMAAAQLAAQQGRTVPISRNGGAHAEETAARFAEARPAEPEPEPEPEAQTPAEAPPPAPSGPPAAEPVPPVAQEEAPEGGRPILDDPAPEGPIGDEAT